MHASINIHINLRYRGAGSWLGYAGVQFEDWLVDWCCTSSLQYWCSRCVCATIIRTRCEQAHTQTDPSLLYVPLYVRTKCILVLFVTADISLRARASVFIGSPIQRWLLISRWISDRSVCGCLGRDQDLEVESVILKACICSSCLTVRRAWCVRAQNFMDQYGTKPEYLKNLHFACVDTNVIYSNELVSKSACI